MTGENARSRRLARNAVAYAAAAWVVLQVLDFLGHNFGWPSLLIKEATVIAASGLLLTVVFTWYHGERGAQRISLGEVIACSLIVATTAVVGWRVRGHQLPVSMRTEASSLAVLPFENIGEKAENKYISDGLTEELLNSLADVPGVRVVPRSSAFQASAADNAAETGKRLNATFLVTGSVQRAGDALRVIARLVSSEDGAQVWTHKYDRTAADLFNVETEIAKDIVDALKSHIGSSIGATRATAHVPTEAAHDLYLRGRFAFNKGVPEALQQSLEYYRRAIEADPLYALAYAGQAEAYLWLADAIMAPTIAYPRVRQAASKALELDPQLVEAKTLLVVVSMVYDWKLTEAEREFRDLLSKHPDASALRMYYSSLQIVTQPGDSAISSLRRALELDPLSASVSGITELFLVWARKYDDAIKQHEVTSSLDPHFWFLSSALGDAYREKRMFDSAIAAYRDEETVIGRPSPGLGVTYARMGKRTEAVAIARALEGLRGSQYIAADRIACIYGALGDLDTAFKWLDLGIRERDTWLVWIKAMPEFDELRRDPRYRQVLNAVGLKE